MMKNRDNSSFDVQDVLWLLVVAVNPSNLPIFVFKLNWTLKKRTEFLGDWRDLQWATVSWLAVLRCSIKFIQDRISDLKGKKCIVIRTSQLKYVFRLEECRWKGQNSLTLSRQTTNWTFDSHVIRSCSLKTAGNLCASRLQANFRSLFYFL